MLAGRFPRFDLKDSRCYEGRFFETHPAIFPERRLRAARQSSFLFTPHYTREAQDRRQSNPYQRADGDHAPSGWQTLAASCIISRAARPYRTGILIVAFSGAQLGSVRRAELLSRSTVTRWLCARRWSASMVQCERPTELMTWLKRWHRHHRRSQHHLGTASHSAGCARRVLAARAITSPVPSRSANHHLTDDELTPPLPVPGAVRRPRAGADPGSAATRLALFRCRHAHLQEVAGEAGVSKGLITITLTDKDSYSTPRNVDGRWVVRRERGAAATSTHMARSRPRAVARGRARRGHVRAVGAGGMARWTGACAAARPCARRLLVPQGPSVDSRSSRFAPEYPRPCR